MMNIVKVTQQIEADMSNIPKRLRDLRVGWADPGDVVSLCDEAAAEIERLENALERSCADRIIDTLRPFDPEMQRRLVEAALILLEGKLTR